MKPKLPRLKGDQGELVSTRIGGTLRRLRKSARLSQEDLARLLSLHQAAVCRVEKGQQNLEPWHLQRIAEIFDIRVSGLMNDCPNYWHVAERFGNKPPLPVRYRELPYSKGREVLPIIGFMTAEQGPASVRRSLERFGLDQAYLQAPDQPIGVNCVLDLLRQTIKDGLLNNRSLRSLVLGAQTENVQGFLHEIYRTQEAATNLLTTFILNRHHYNTNFSYELTECNGRGMTVAVTPAEHMKGVEYRDETLGDVLCRYRRETFTQLPRYIGAKPVEVAEEECHHRGAGRCVYTLKAV